MDGYRGDEPWKVREPPIELAPLVSRSGEAVDSEHLEPQIGHNIVFQAAISI